MAEERVTKDDRRTAAREKAAAMREQRRRQQRRRRVIIQSSIITGVLAVVAIVALLIVTGIGSANQAAINALGPKNMASGGITLTSTTTALTTPASKNPRATAAQAGKLQIKIYQDYQCPYCKAFDTQSGAYIKSLLDANKITYEIHPLIFLNNYSARAANAAACVANSEPRNFWAYNQLLYANQPEEGGTATLSNRQLADLATEAGVKGQSVLDCIRKGTTYQDWLIGQSDYAQNSGAQGTNIKKIDHTPTVTIDGTEVPIESLSTPAAFQAAVEAAAKAKGVDLSS